MIFFSHIDPIVGFVSILAILIILLGLILKKYSQPYIIGYILVGAILGEHGFGLIKEAESIQHLGEIGIILLLFFIGMEINIPDLIKSWKIAAFGTLFQVLFSVAIVVGIGFFFDWKIERSVVIGFVIALSSSAVVIKLIETKKMITTKVGQNVLSILLTQDIIIVPMLIVVSMLGGSSESTWNIIWMIVGGILIVGALLYIYTKRTIKLPFEDKIEHDHELQVFLAIFFCFGGALFSSLFGLSPALGAFVGGMIMQISKSTKWMYNTLHSFRVLFVAIFFVSVGLQIDIDFIIQNVWAITSMVFVVFILNHFINATVLRMFSCNWKGALLGGAMLAQIGELSFLLSSSAFHLHIIGDYGYKFTISLISLTLIIGPFWISLTEKMIAKFSPKSEVKSNCN